MEWANGCMPSHQLKPKLTNSLMLLQTLESHYCIFIVTM